MTAPVSYMLVKIRTNTPEQIGESVISSLSRLVTRK